MICLRERANFNMEESKETKFICKFCYKQFPSGNSLGGHIRIHPNESLVSSDRYNGNKKNKVVDQREIVVPKQKQLCCTECVKRFDSLEALCAHMACHSEREKMLIYSQSETETSSAHTSKRSKRVLKQSNSEIGQEDRDGAVNLMMMSSDSSFKKGRNLAVNSLGELSDNNSVILETKSCSGEEELKILNVKNQVLETDKVAKDDQLRSVDDNDAILSDSDSSDSDYFMNGPKKSDSDTSVDGSLRNTGFGLNRMKNSDGGSKDELNKSKKVLPSDATDSWADTNSMIHRFIDSKSTMVKKASGEKKKNKDYVCPICFKVFKSGQAMGGHKRSHSIVNQEHNQEAETRCQIDLNVPASDIDE